VIEADEKDSLMMHIVENMARGESDPISIAQVLDKAIQAGSAEEEIAKATGHTIEWVRFYRGLLKLPEIYQQALAKGELTVSAVREALRLDDPREIDYALTQALRLGWSAAVVHQYVERRISELEMVKARERALGEPQPRPEPDAEKLLQYDECMLCKRRVLKQDTFMHIICVDCKDLTKYILDNVGPPNEAIQVVYEALKQFYDYQKYLELKERFEKKESA